MKKFIMILLILNGCLTTQAQLKHYITGNRVYYANFFNDEQDKPEDLGTYFSAPRGLSYKIEKDKWGLELYYTKTNVNYNFTKYGEVDTGDLLDVYTDVIGLNVHYGLIQHERIKVSPFAGVFYREFSSEVFLYWQPAFRPGTWIPGTKYENEKDFGFQLGANIHIPIYWGIYANSNLRYNAIPWAKYNKQNFLVEFGLGYCIQRKSRQSK